jgi:hypothetical protein
MGNKLNDHNLSLAAEINQDVQEIACRYGESNGHYIHHKSPLYSLL